MEKRTINFISKNIKIKNNNENLLFFNFIEDYFGNICYKKLKIDEIISILATEENKGVIDYLVNLMNQKYINESYFYINQLCIMLTYKNYKTSIKRFLYNNCLKNLKFCLKCYLLLKSFEKTEKISKILFKIEEIISKQDLKKVLKEKKQFFNYKPDSELNYFEINLYFYEILKNMCIKLLDYPISNEKNNNCITRKEIFKTFIKSINDYFYDMRYVNYLKINKKQNDENKENNIFLNKGFILPFNSNKNTFEDSYLILNIIKEESNIFNTYSRVPMKLTCECIKNYKMETFYKLIDDEQFFDNIHNFDNLNLKNSQSFLSISTNLNLYEFKNNQIIDKWINLEKDLKKFKENKNNIITNSTSNLLDFLDFEENKEKSFIFLSYKIDDFKPFGDEDITNNYKQKSKFKNFDSYQIKSFIVKANDDLLQEMLILQIIKKFSDILKPLKIDIISYEIVMIGERTGILEFLTNSSSINYILNKIPNDWNISKFFFNYFKNNLEDAKITFLNSLVGFCLISYFLQIKDRHNENILIDNKGRIMHIDFGFVLGASPGGINIEKSNMKLTKDFVEILGGLESNLFKLFKIKFINAIFELQKHYYILKLSLI